MPEYLSNKKRKQSIGINSYSEYTDTTKIIGNVLVGFGSVGVGTTVPTQDVDVNTIRVRDTLYDYTNSGGEFGYYLVKDTDGIKWVAVPPIDSNAIFVAENNNILGVSSFTGINIISDELLGVTTNTTNPNFADITILPRWIKSGDTGIYTTKNVGIGTTIPTTDFQVGFGTTGVTIDGSIGVVSALGYYGNYAFIDQITVNDQLNVVGLGSTLVAAFLASAGGITTTGGDLYVGGSLFADKLDIINLKVVNIEATGITTLNVGIVSTFRVTGVSTLGVTSTKDLFVDANLKVSGITTLGITSTKDLYVDENLYVVGIATATRFSTGATGSAINITSNTISGPAEIIIDPADVGDNSGAVRIKGDLFVDGEEFIVNSTTIELADFNVGIASTVGTNLLLDGAGIGIGSTNIRKTLTYDYSSDSLKSSENFDLATGKVYKINETEVLSSTQLTVTNINATGVSTLGFATIGQLYVSGVSTFVGVGTFINDLYVGGDLYVADDIFFDELNAKNANITGITTLNVGIVSTFRVTGVSTLGVTSTKDLFVDANLKVSGITTLGVTSTTNLTSQQLNVSGITTLGVTSTINLTSQQLNVSGITTLGVTSISQLNVSGITTLGVTSTTNLTSQQLNVSGITTLGVTSTTNLTSQQLNVSGITTLGVTSTTNLTSQQLNVSGITTLGITTAQQFYVSGVSTFVGVGTFINDLYVGKVLYAKTVDFDNIEVENIKATGISTLNVGIVSTLTVSGISTLGVTSTTNLTSQQLLVTGITTLGVTTITQLYVSGVSTFSDRITGIISTAAKLETQRTFEITGDISASPILFDGTGNVSFAATIQPNSVGLGTDTFGDYVKDITGTLGEITVTGGTGEGSSPIISFAPNPTIGGNVTIGNDLQVNNNLNVTGNITVGGTQGYLLVENLRVSDKDIVLGFTTDSNNNDASTDTTANHGGIAIASTEGNPLVTLTNPGVGETLPATYKKFMWFKAGSFGIGTDAWLSNYAIGIGSTQFPTGTRLAAGSVQFTENDLAVVRNINASGIITATEFKGTLTGYASSAGIATNLNGGPGVVYQYNTGITSFVPNATVDDKVLIWKNNVPVWGTVDTGSLSGSIDYAVKAGVATYADNAGIATNLKGGATGSVPYQLNTGITTFVDNSSATPTQVLRWNGSVPVWGDISAGSIVGVVTYADRAGIATNVIGGIASVTSLNVTGITTLSSIVGTSLSISGISTLGVTSTTNLTTQQLRVTGITTLGVTSTTNLTSQQLLVTGITTLASVVGTSLSITGISTIANFRITNVGTGATVGGSNVTYYGDGSQLTGSIPNTITNIDINRIYYPLLSPVDSGTVKDISVSSTSIVFNPGTDSLGIGTTNPTSKLTVVGDISASTTLTAPRIVGTSLSITGISTIANFIMTPVGTGATVGGIGVTYYGDGRNLTDIVSGYATTAGIATNATNVIGGIASVTSLNVTGITTLASIVGTSLSITGISTLGVTSTTNLTTQQLNVTGITTLASIVGTSLSISGISTIANFRITNVGTGATVGGIGVTYYGDGSGLTNINLSSVVGVVTYAERAGIATYADRAGIATNVIGGIASVTSLNVSGITTLGTVEISSGIVTAKAGTGIVTYYGDGSKLSGVSAFSVQQQDLTASPVYPTFANGVGSTSLGISSTQVAYIPASGNLGIGTTTPTSKLTVVGDVLVSGVLTATRLYSGIYGEFVGGSISGSDIVGTSLSITGISTLGSVKISSGIITSTTGGIVTYYGDGSKLTNIVSGYATTAGIATYATNAGIATNVIGGIASVTSLDVTGITTLRSIVGTSLSITGISTIANFRITNVGTGATVGGIGVTYYGDGSNLTNIVSGYATTAGIATNVIGGIASVTSLDVTGITTLRSIVGTSLSISGISTIANFRMSPVGTGATVGGIGVTYYGDGSQLTNIVTSIVAGTNITISGSTGQVTINSSSSGGGSISISTNTANQSQYITYVAGTGNTTGLGVTIGGLVFNPASGNLGIGTITPTSKLDVRGNVLVSGVLTATRLYSSIYGEFTGGSVSATNIVGTSLSITGISTFTNGPVLIGTGTSTGTTLQILQVTGGAYVSGNLGIGTTNPTKKLDVNGAVNATYFRGSGATSSMANYWARQTWTSRSNPVDNSWNAVAWSKELGIFAAVSATGSGNRVMTSPNGINWTSKTTSTANNWRGICWAAELGLFVAVAWSGAGNRVMTSPNGTTWTTQTQSFDRDWQSVCWSPELGLLVAVSNYQGIQCVMTSPNGINWTLANGAQDNQWFTVVWASELRLFVAVSGAANSGTGSQRVMTSPDGINWTGRTAAAQNVWVGLCWSPELGLFAAVSYTGSGNRVMTSPDGINWTSQISSADNQWLSVCWAAELGLFVAVSNDGTSNRVMTSPNGIKWTTRTPAADNQWNSICWSPEQSILVAVSDSGTGTRVMTSP